MAPFKRALVGYRRADVDSALAGRDGQLAERGRQIGALQGQVGSLEGQVGVLGQELARGRAQIAASERETTELAAMVIEREREIHILGQRLREANEIHDRSIAVLDSVTARLDEMQAQARGQATRIRMKALREAVEVSKRVQALNEAQQEAEGATAEAPVMDAAENGNGGGNGLFDGFYEGDVKLEIGPLGDFSQLVGFEDAIGATGASDITIDRFSEGRASLSMHFEEPVDLLRELEERSALDFKVRHTAPDNLILDVDDDGSGEQFAA